MEPVGIILHNVVCADACCDHLAVHSSAQDRGGTFRYEKLDRGVYRGVPTLPYRYYTPPLLPNTHNHDGPHSRISLTGAYSGASDPLKLVCVHRDIYTVFPENDASPSAPSPASKFVFLLLLNSM